MQMTAERKSLLIKIGVGVAAVIVVAAVTVLTAHLLNPQVAKTTNSVASTSSTAQVAPTPTLPTIGSTDAINLLTTQDSGSEQSINTTYENNNVTADQSTNQAAASMGSAYDESSY